MDIKLENEQATRIFAEDLALCLQKGDLLALSGDLGAGKTFLARALIRALADDDTLEAPSPTFTLLQIYEETRIPLAHADIYRIEAAEEAEELGLDEFLETGIVLLEWPEKAPAWGDKARFRLHLRQTGETERQLTITAAAEAEDRLRQSLAARAFLRRHGRASVRRRFLQGDASPRSYEILRPDGGGKTEILMLAPAREITDKNRAAYVKKAHLAADNRPFIAVCRLLRAEGYKAPQIYAENAAQTLLILEDLGREGLTDAENKPIAKRYLAAAEFLAKFHQTDWRQAAAAQNCPLPLYDETALQTEADLLAEWYFPHKTGKTAMAAWRAQYRHLWQKLFAKLPAGGQILALRDFHSPNILWQKAEQGVKRIGLIDFQDAALGSPAYDLVSLAQDARITIAPLLEQQIKEAYFTASKAFAAALDAEKTAAAYAVLGAQRAAKILGVFVRLSRQDGKAAYLRHLPRIEAYLQRNLQAEALRPLRLFLRESGVIDG